MFEAFDTVRSLITRETVNHVATARGIKIPDTENMDQILAYILRCVPLGTNEAWAVITVELTGGKITGDMLTRVLTVALPHRKIGGQHGPFYLSKIRTGKLQCIVPVSGGRAPTVVTRPAEPVSIATMIAGMSPADIAALRAILEKAPS